jgi:hypothetical protein
VYAYVGDLEGQTYENEGLNANIGLVVTPAGATFQAASSIGLMATLTLPDWRGWVHAYCPCATAHPGVPHHKIMTT